MLLIIGSTLNLSSSFYALLKPLKLDHVKEKPRRLRGNADTTAQESLGEVVKELRKFMLPEQPYSGAAKCAIMALRGSHPVAETVLLGSQNSWRNL
jgi:hypothetical protein